MSEGEREREREGCERKWVREGGRERRRKRRRKRGRQGVIEGGKGGREEVGQGTAGQKLPLVLFATLRLCRLSYPTGARGEVQYAVLLLLLLMFLFLLMLQSEKQKTGPATQAYEVQNLQNAFQVQWEQQVQNMYDIQNVQKAEWCKNISQTTICALLLKLFISSRCKK